MYDTDSAIESLDHELYDDGILQANSIRERIGSSLTDLRTTVKGHVKVLVPMYKKKMKNGLDWWVSRFIMRPFTTFYYTYSTLQLVWGTAVNIVRYNTPILTGNNAIGVYGSVLLWLPVCYGAQWMLDKEIERRGELERA